jgi:hypothetical protein
MARAVLAGFHLHDNRCGLKLSADSRMPVRYDFLVATARPGFPLAETDSLASCYAKLMTSLPLACQAPRDRIARY